jgi:manganese-dependent inorganic pyrophosphatase
MIVVIGHNNPDVDSCASAIVQAARLSASGQTAQAYISGTPTREAQELLRFLNLPLPPIWSEKRLSQPTVLVDCNEITQLPGSLSNVIAIIDHHPDSGHFPQAAFRQIEQAGSTASLLARQVLSQHEQLPYQLGCLLLAGIISDTKQFLSPQATDEDKFLAAQLSQECGIPLLELANRLQGFSCYRFAPELIPEFLTQSVKCNLVNGHLVCSASIETDELSGFLAHYREIEAALPRLDGEVKMLIVTDLKHRLTALIHHGRLPLASPHLMNGICLRKQEIRQLLKQQLD